MGPESFYGSGLIQQEIVGCRAPDEGFEASGLFFGHGYTVYAYQGPAAEVPADELVNFSRPAIDVLFESAADAYGAGLMGAILSGANQDGAAGLAAVARAGGLAIVEDPAGAYAPQMPGFALAACPTAKIIPLKKIASALLAWGAA